MWIFALRERPHPGAQLTLFEAADGWRYSLWSPTCRHQPGRGHEGLEHNAYVHAVHRIHARIEDAIRTGKETGLDTSLPLGFQVNAARLPAAMTGQILLTWLKLLALDGDLARAEPNTLGYRVLDAAARLVRGGRK